MKSIKEQNAINESQRIGRNTSRIAEALQTDIAIKYAEILDRQKAIKTSSLDEDFSDMERLTAELYRSVLAGFSNIADEVIDKSGKIFNQSIKEAKKLVKIDSDDEIKKYLYKITGDQLLSNQKIAYKNGRRIGYKEYVEMATRTRVQHQLVEQEQELGLLTSQLFYICDTFSDCANDHLDYQGKFYYSEKVLAGLDKGNTHYKEIMAGVRKCKSSIERVSSDMPFLTTRPNCRHRLIPIAIDDVVEKSVHTVLREQGANKGDYAKSVIKKNYDDSQRQRKIEKYIRTAKRNSEIFERFYDKTKDEEILKMLNNAKAKIRLGQANMRKLVKENETLKRDYRRENPYHLQKDLGVAYNSEKIRVRVDVKEENIQDFSSDKHALIVSDRLNDYTKRELADMSEFMRDNESFKKRVSKDVYFDTQEKIEELHSLFLEMREKEVEYTQGVVVYYAGENIIKDNTTTTLIANSFLATSPSQKIALGKIEAVDENVALYKIIMSPQSQNQALFNKDKSEVLIDTNSVYDIVGQEVVENMPQFTLLLRPKHKGAKR